MPNEINITITEDDRQKAGRYSDPKNCLVCTALKRMGFTKISVVPGLAKIGKHSYSMNPLVRAYDVLNRRSVDECSYPKRVVGMKIKLELQS